MARQKSIPPGAERKLLRLERDYENGLIPEKDYEVFKKRILSRATGIPSGPGDVPALKKDRAAKQKPDKLPPPRGPKSGGDSPIKKAFPILIIGIVLLGISYGILNELNQESRARIFTLDRPSQTGTAPTTQTQTQAQTPQTPYEPTVPQINVPPPESSTLTITTPSAETTPTNTVVESYLSQERSSHTFSVQDAGSITYRLQHSLEIGIPRIIDFGTPSIYRGEGIVDSSVVRGGYYLFSDRPPKDDNILLTLFAIEPGREERFFKELNAYMSRFHDAYNIDATLYEMVDGPKITETPSIEYRFNFYPLGDDSFKSNVKLIAIKSSNLVVYIYYLDNSGNFALQGEKERKIMEVLNEYL